MRLNFRVLRVEGIPPPPFPARRPTSPFQSTRRKRSRRAGAVPGGDGRRRAQGAQKAGPDQGGADAHIGPAPDDPLRVEDVPVREAGRHLPAAGGR